MTSEFDPYAAPASRAHPGRHNEREDLPALATRWQRFGGRMIDTVALILLIFMTGFFVAIVVAAGGLDANPEEENLLLGFLTLGLGGCLYFALQTVLLVKRSQTLGKIISGTRIHVHGQASHAGPLATVLVRAVVPFMINVIFSLFGLVDAVFIFGEERRCLHDIMAGTDVRVAD